MNDGETATIPEPLLARLKAERGVLCRQGCIQFRVERDRRPFYRLRFRRFDPHLGCKRHRSILLGPDPAVAQAVKSMLGVWRQEHLLERQHESQVSQRQQEARRNEILEECAIRQSLAAIVMAAGGGKHQIRDILQVYARCATDVRRLWMFGVMLGNYKPPLRGRPPAAWRGVPQGGARLEKIIDDFLAETDAIGQSLAAQRALVAQKGAAEVAAERCQKGPVEVAVKRRQKGAAEPRKRVGGRAA